MSNFNKMVAMIDGYLTKYDIDISIKSDIHRVSYNDSEKVYSNWYMIMDMIFEMRGNENEYFDFDYNNPIKFAKEHVTYIIVCTLEKNPDIYRMIKNNDRTGKKYTAPFLERIKAYLFKDAYIYTEKYLERKFVKNFEY